MSPSTAVAAIAIMLVACIGYLLLKRIIAVGGKAPQTLIEHKRAVFGDDWARYRTTQRTTRKQHRPVLRWRRKAS